MRLWVFVIFLFFISSCTKDVGRVNRGNYPDHINTIISSNCSVSGCHNAASSEAAGNLNLETWETMFRGSSNGAAVVPFSSRFSPLCYYINVYPELGLQSKPTMPLNKAPLSKEQVIEIKNWIDAGAPDKNNKIIGAENPSLKKLYAVNQGCDVVTVFDNNTQLPIRYIEVGKGNSVPHHLRVSPDGKFWYVIFINNNIMKKYRCSDDAFVGDIPLTPKAAGTGDFNAVDWNTFVISGNGKFAYCVSYSTFGCVSKVDLENMKFVKVLTALPSPHGIVLNADETKFYLAAQQGNYITEIDTSFESSSIEYTLDGGTVNPSSGPEPHDLALTPDGKKLLITCQKTNDVRIFDLQSKTVTSIIKTALYPQEIVYSKKFNTYYISCPGDGSTSSPGAVTSISGDNFIAKDLKCGAQPHGIAVDETTDLLYVLSRNIAGTGPLPHHSSQCNGRNGFVNFVDLRTFTITEKKYELSVDPYFIFARP